VIQAIALRLLNRGDSEQRHARMAGESAALSSARSQQYQREYAGDDDPHAFIPVRQCGLRKHHGSPATWARDRLDIVVVAVHVPCYPRTGDLDLS
jgi:hypothetical protein